MRRLFCISLFTFFGFIVSFTYAQKSETDIERFENELLSGTNPKLLEQLRNKTDYAIRSGDALIISKYYCLIGDYYLNKSDIESALKSWTLGANALDTKFGLKSVFQTVKYQNLSKYYSYLIKADSALYFAQKAISICRTKKDSLKYIRVDKIYKQYGYAVKIKVIQNNNVLKGTFLARQYYDSALYYNRKFNCNKLFYTKLIVDIGNTYTDEIVYYQRLKQFKDAGVCQRQANIYYDNAIKDIRNEFGNNNQLLSTTYLVKGLSYLYCYDTDSLTIVLTNYQKGLIALTLNYSDTSIFSCLPVKTNILNESSILVLLRFKIDALHNLYIKTHKKQYLDACYSHSKIVFKIWRDFFTHLKTEEIHLATEIYGTAPFGSSIPFCNEYYQLTKDKTIAENVFYWVDLNKYSVLLKQQIDNGAISLKANNITIPDIQNRLKTNQAIIEYYYNAEGFNCVVITNNSFQLHKLNFPIKSNSKIDSLIKYLKVHDAEKYCTESKSIYDLIVKPVVKDLSAGINELIIIPHDKLYNLPFDGLVTNTAKSYKNADFLIKHYKISYALSCNLLFNDASEINFFNSVSYINPNFTNELSLPFSNLLTEKIKKEYPTVKYKYNTQTKSSILHLATHAFCEYNNSRNSYLLVEPNEKLFLKELKNKISPAPLVIVSACETGNGTLELGEGVVNFSRQFYLAGIKSSITTLWKVDDEATASILENFYLALKEGENSIDALHLAKLNYLRKAKTIDDYDPYYWSGIVYTGKSVIYKDNGKNKSLILYSCIGLLGLLLGFLLMRKKFFRN